ncbi:MAG TPA: hypothetical protein VGL54_08580 [Solirubrobacteraceae bacterium]|jgi:hypothetical protein
MSGAVARRLAVGLLGISFAVALPAVAQANNLFSIDPQAESTGPIVTDSSGTGYVAWNREGSEVEQPMFCKIPRGDSCTDPIALSLPVQSPQSADGVIQPFPVLGGAVGVVYVVGPRYNRDDTLIWTSTNGGESFTVKEIPTGSFPDKTGVGDVLFNPNFDAAFPAATDETFAIAGENPGIGYGNTSNITTESTPTSFTFADPGADVSGATLGFTTKTKVRLGHAAFPAVEAYWTDTTPYQVDFYRYPAKPAPETEAGGWEGPFTATDGYEPHLAGGPSGLFLLSTDLASGEPAGEQPSVIDVRKYNEATEAFEAPTTIANIPTDSGTLFTSGDIFQNPVTGALYVVQPVSENGEYVMRLWESTDGGQTFHGERDIATIGYGYEGVPRLAVAEDGHGWLTFKDYGGLEVADLNPLAFATTPIIGAPVPSPTPLPAPTPLPTTTTTTQSGAGSAGASITVPQGTAVSDQAHIAGAAVASATGTVTYNLYKDSKCTVAATAGSTASVLGGVAGPSAAVKPGPGTYYWKVSYGGNATNDGSTSACGSEVLVVAVNEKHLGLPPSNACLSKRAFLVHPRAPKGVKLVSVEVLINGKLKKKGALSGHATTVNLAGLPKGTFKVALITKSSKGKTYEELRTFHTCVAGKHKKK